MNDIHAPRAQALSRKGFTKLRGLARKINHHDAEAIRGAETALEHAGAAGACLIQAKDMVPHGGWLGWLEANCQVSPRTAQVYMQIARTLHQDGANTQRAAYLRQVLALAGPPRRPVTVRFVEDRTPVAAVPRRVIEEPPIEKEEPPTTRAVLVTMRDAPTEPRDPPWRPAMGVHYMGAQAP